MPDPSRLLGLSIVLGIVAAGCGPKRAAEEDVAAELRAKVRTVAIAPVLTATLVVERSQVEAAFVGRTTDRLAASGLRVVGPGTWDEIWRRYAGDVGGVYDASTGEADEEKHRVVSDATHRELVEAHSVDAILYLELRPIETYGVRVHPQVCGGTAAPYWPGGWFKRGNGASLVRTACLVGFLQDPSGKQYFARHAPIEGIETYDQQTRAVRPRDAVFQDPLRLDRAVEIVLEPLLAAPGDRAAKASSGAGAAPSTPGAPELADEPGKSDESGESGEPGESRESGESVESVHGDAKPDEDRDD